MSERVECVAETNSCGSHAISAGINRSVAEQHRVQSAVAAFVDSRVLRATARENFDAITLATRGRAHATVERSNIGKFVPAGH